ncbi:hypothetical protein LWI29_003972 [Acer saccharum]|uniref:Uncharacterized protein n=1 Tax=Acer saccharum TaxID=4024 RepID=A0AA39VQR9_ACESA|nr:hypothetical protein LWI29_003972 [Acer saccharum]
MFKKTLDQLGIEKARLKEVNTPLYRFTGDSIWPLGTVDIPITFGEDPDQFTTLITYVVVNVSTVYSMTLGRPFLVATKAGVSLYHNVVKNPTDNGFDLGPGDGVGGDNAGFDGGRGWCRRRVIVAVLGSS